MAELVNTIAHDIIQNDSNRLSQISELKFFTDQLKLQKYGQIYARVFMASLLSDLCGRESEYLEESWGVDDWDSFIDDIDELYKVLIRKDVRLMFVPRLEETSEIFETDTAAFQKGQQKVKNRDIDVATQKLLSRQFHDIMARLKFQKALSIIRPHLKDLIVENDEGELENLGPWPYDAVVVTAFVDFINGPMFDDYQHLRDALFSLVDQSQNDVLNLKEPRELKRMMKKDSFLKYQHLVVCQDRVDSVLRGWEDLVLPLPKHKRIGEYNIPEVRLEGADGDCHGAEEEEVHDENDDIDDEVEVIEEDEDEEIVEYDLSPSIDQDEQHDDMEENNDDSEEADDQGDESPSDFQPETQPPQNKMIENNGSSDEESDEADDLGDETPADIQLETQPPQNNKEFHDFEVEEERDDDDSQIEEQLETQPNFNGFEGHTKGIVSNSFQGDIEDEASFCTAQEVQDDDSKMGTDALENLREKRNALRMNAKDPLDTILELAATATITTRDLTPIRKSPRLTTSSNRPLNDPVASVNSEELNSKVSPKTPKRGSSATHTRLEIQDDSEEEVLHTTPVQEKKRRRNPGSRLEDSDKDGLWADSQEPLPKQRKKPSKWTEKEVTALKAGYKKYGHQWSKIKSEFSTALKDRNNVHIKVITYRAFQ